MAGKAQRKEIYQPINIYNGGIDMDEKMERKPLEENEVVVHIPKGTAKYVKVMESESDKLGSEIVVQISKKRKPGPSSVLGVIVK